MATPAVYKKSIAKLKKEFHQLKKGKDSLLQMIDETEIPENVYNSNAIENSTLTLGETEKILLDQEVSRDLNLREIYEAKNLARVVEYIRTKSQESELTIESILNLHQMLMGVINDRVAGRFRTGGEYVRVGTHIGTAPEHVEKAMESLLLKYQSNLTSYFIDNIAKLHLDFETIHPFNDGNGRIGRVLIDYQLHRLQLPPIIIQNKSKQKYYASFNFYRESGNTKPMERIISLALIESLHKRITYLKGQTIISIADHARDVGKPVPHLLNSARRQTIPAFREKGTWKIGVESN